MDFLQWLSNNFWLTVVLCLFIISIVSIIFGILLEAYKASIRTDQKKMELRNEELRLQLKLEQQKKENAAGIPPADLPRPKEPSWEEQSQTSYQMGYQQHG
jgi:predicted Holliday junction resolvase-like endonuclease